MTGEEREEKRKRVDKRSGVRRRGEEKEKQEYGRQKEGIGEG
jgi:hypothetical protein